MFLIEIVEPSAVCTEKWDFRRERDDKYFSFLFTGDDQFVE